MSINLDDPNLTAFALGELSGGDKEAMQQAVAESPEAQAFVAEIQDMAGLLKGEFRGELEHAAAKPLNILPLPQESSFWSDSRWGSLAVAALLAVGAVIAAVTLSGILSPATRVADRQSESRGDASQPVVQMEVDSRPTAASTPTDLFASNTADVSSQRLQESAAVPMAAPPASPRAKGDATARLNKPAETQTAFNTAEYDHFEENPFLPAATNPLSTFSIDVDTASYANVRRFINSGTRPPKDAVRIEEMINYFSYDYPQPTGDRPFSVNLDAATCPWQPEHHLVRIGLKGREIGAEKRGASNLVFLLDVSGSMEPSDRLPLVKSAMRLLIEKLTENDRVAIVVYAGGSGVALPPTRGDRKEEIVRALEELKAGGSTNGAQGIELAYRIAADNFIKGGVNRVVLATDGDFNVGVTSQGELVRLAEEKAKGGVFLTVLGVGNDNLKDSTMKKLADKANGNYAYLDSIEEARKVLVQQMNGTLVTIAKDVKVQVEFNPAQVASYRLIGYENRMLRKEDFNNDKVDAGEIGAGHTVTALYEVVPVGAKSDPSATLPAVDPLKYQSGGLSSPAAAQHAASGEMLTVKLRHKQPDGDASVMTERSLGAQVPDFSQAPADFRFAAAVAQFGMILRDSPHKGNGTLAGVFDLAAEAKGRDESGYRAGFVELVRKAQTLAF